jgi:hypothetical protein
VLLVVEDAVSVLPALVNDVAPDHVSAAKVSVAREAVRAAAVVGVAAAVQDALAVGRVAVVLNVATGI